MEQVLNFLAENWIWFAGVSVFFALALIGLIFEGRKKKKKEEEEAKTTVAPTPVQTQATPVLEQEFKKADPEVKTPVTVTPTLDGLGTAPTAQAPNVAPELAQEQPISAAPTLIIEEKK